MTETFDYDPYDPAVKENPQWYMAQAREKCPVHHHTLSVSHADMINASPLVKRPVAEFWSAMRYADVVEMLQNPHIYSSKQGPGPERLEAPDGIGVLNYADEPHHSRQRRIVQKAFTPRIIATMTDQIQQTADELIDQFADTGHTDLMGSYAHYLPTSVISDLLGAPPEDRRLFSRWVDDIVAGYGGDPESWARAFNALSEMYAYSIEQVELRRAIKARGAEPPEDLLSAITFAPYEERQFTNDELAAVCQTLLTAGGDTTMHAITNAIHTLCTHPEQRAMLEADWSLLDNTVEECLRFAPPVDALFRHTTQDTVLGGCPIPADAKIRPMFASANRDKDFLPDGDVFRIDRDPRQLRRHLTFGNGIHACIGAALARAELRISISTLLKRLPGLDLDPDRPNKPCPHFPILGWNTLYVRWDPGA